MAPFQQRFHAAAGDHSNRFMLAPTKSGKTYGGAAESWWYLTDAHPFAPTFGPDSLGFVLCPDHVTGWPEISRCLRELEPPDTLGASCRYTEAAGYYYSTPTGARPGIVTKTGARLECKSCTQSPQALEGPRVHWAWVNEVPKQVHFDALLGRLSYDGGPVFGTTTPVGRPTDWLRNKIEGNAETGIQPEQPGWWVDHVALSYENMPHRLPGTIELQIARTDAWEHNQRILAQWDGVSAGRKLPGFTDGCLFGDELYAESYDAFRLGIDHGEGDGKEVAYLVGLQRIGHRTRVTLLAEYVSREETGFRPADHAKGILAMLTGLGVSYHALQSAHGDTNSAGMLAAGMRYNTLLEDAIAREMRLARCPVAIVPAVKRAGAPKASISAMNSACSEGLWRVHESCRKFVASARHFTGKEADLKDAIDAARYPVMDILLDPGTVGAPLELVL